MIQRVGWWIIAAALVGGCQAERYRSRQMGSVDFDRAYQAAVDTVGIYYPILSTDAAEGRIVSAPRSFRIGTSPLSRQRGREWAEMRIRRAGPIVWADVRVTVEHQVAAEPRGFGTILVPYRDVQPLTPAERRPDYLEGGETWTPVGTNTDMEWQILDDLYDKLHK